MADKITWVRPSGTEITTNGDQDTVKYAAELGWNPKGEKAPVATIEDEKPEYKPRGKKGG